VRAGDGRVEQLVVAREGDQVTKSPLAARFQEAIDEAAMRLGETGSGAYLEGWTRGEWTTADGGCPGSACSSARVGLWRHKRARLRGRKASSNDRTESRLRR